jgi:hypothetical protein
MLRRLRDQPLLALLLWGALAVEFVASALQGHWPLAGLALATIGLSLLPVVFANRFGIRLPPSFLGAIVAFVFATIFLGEAFDFYERYWWWDVVMHTVAALGFGLLGFLLMLMLFKGDRYAAPPWAVAFFGFCFAIMLGALWEIFEFAMDRQFGLNMQKSGLPDTMLDMIVTVAGATVGAGAGFLYLKGLRPYGLERLILDFITQNGRFYRKLRDRRVKRN